MVNSLYYHAYQVSTCSIVNPTILSASMKNNFLPIMKKSLKQTSCWLVFAFTLIALSAPLNAQKNDNWRVPDLQQERFIFEKNISFDPSIQSPAAFLGYELGERMSIYYQVVDYAKNIAEQSNRVSYNEYGQTHEGRPLVYLVITHPDNHARLEEIRLANAKLSDPLATSEAEAQEIMKTNPVVISHSYTIHGNEASSTEAAMQVAYRLAAATDAKTEALLKDVVFIAYITVNPDGRDRYAYWYNSVAKNVVGINADELEHDAPWPNGRTNHYWFDLNRDWIWGVHPEMRGLTGVYQQWLPQLHVDYHEQGYNANYFTMPGTTPRNKLLPDLYEAFSDTIGRANGKFFDEEKLNYFTREAFDFFYPGYGSSYPSVFGAIGMLTEQGGIGAGRAVVTNDGYILTFRQRIYDHYKTSLATIGKAAEHKNMFQKYTYDANNPNNSKSDIKAYVFENDANGHLNQVLDILMHHKVEVHQLTDDWKVKKAQQYPNDGSSSTTLKAGSYVVSTNQARHLFINSLMQKDMTIEDSVMYDMSTWSAPLAYNLGTHAVYDEVKSAVLTKLESAPKNAGKIHGNVAKAYAFVIDWDQKTAPQALSLLWKQGYRVRSAEKSFSPDGKLKFPEGSLIVLVGRNLVKSATMSADIATIAESTGVQIHALASGRMLEGIDLASNRSRPVTMPKVGMLVDEPFSTNSSGFIYYLFDQEVVFPVNRIRASSLKQSALSGVGRSRYGGADLLDYDVLVLPPASRLNRVFDKGGKAELLAWIRNGGTLVLNGSSAQWFASDSTLSGAVKLRKMTPSANDKAVASDLRYEERERHYGLKRIPGAAMVSKVDGSNPLAFGLPDHFYNLKFNADVLEPNSSLNSAVRYESDVTKLMASGYASSENLEHIAGGTMAGVMDMGQGKVVFIMDDTQYRMFWRGGERLLINAVMILGAY